MKKNDWIVIFLRIGVGGIFALSGYLKLMESPAHFTGSILSYELVDARTASWAAHVMPWAELLLGVFFMLGLWPRLSLYGLWAMNVVFIAAITSALARKLPIRDCGCFGENSHAWPIQWTLVLDLVMFGALLFVSRTYSKNSQTRRRA